MKKHVRLGRGERRMMFVYSCEEKIDACVAPKNQSDCWSHLIGNGITWIPFMLVNQINLVLKSQ